MILNIQKLEMLVFLNNFTFTDERKKVSEESHFDKQGKYVYLMK
jgi:hypothetical protein